MVVPAALPVVVPAALPVVVPAEPVVVPFEPFFGGLLLVVLLLVVGFFTTGCSESFSSSFAIICVASSVYLPRSITRSIARNPLLRICTRTLLRAVCTVVSSTSNGVE